MALFQSIINQKLAEKGEIVKMLRLSKELFEEHYKGFLKYKENELTQAVADYVNDDQKFAKLEELNEMKIPPAVAFISITYKENRRLFNKYLKSDSDKKCFGALFGAAFLISGYRAIHDRRQLLSTASIFIRE